MPTTRDDAPGQRVKVPSGAGTRIWASSSCFPGYVNLVSLAVGIDLILSGMDGDYPGANEAVARSIALAGLGLVHVLHQLRAALQGFQVLRRLG